MKFFDRFKPKWVLVKTFEEKTYYGNKIHGRDEGKIYFHLYESTRGGRKVEMASTFHECPQEEVDKVGKTYDIYQTKVLRWLSGRYDPGIPRYSELGVEDIVAALKGKV